MHHFRFAAVCLLVSVPVVAQQATPAATGRAFAPADWYRVVTLSNPDVSPDGRLVAFTVTTVNEQENRRHSEVWVVPTSAAGGAPTRYTSPGTESSNPRFSPDGALLFFTSQRTGGTGSTWALRMDRPGGEAFQPERVPSRGSFTRDGKLAVFTDTIAPDTTGARQDDPFRSMGAMARPPFGAITRPLDAARFDGRHVVDMQYKANGRGFVPGPREARTWRAQQLWVQRTGEERRRLTNTAYSHRDAAISPDGRWIAFVADGRLRSDSAVSAERDSIARLPDAALRDVLDAATSEIFVIPAAGGACAERRDCAPRLVAAIPGGESDLAWSPDGRQIAFSWRPTRTSSRRIGVIDAAGGAPVNAIGDFVYEPDQFAWLPNGRIIMQAAIGGRTALHVVDPRTRIVREIIGGRRRIGGGQGPSFATDAAGRVVAFVATSLTQPTELYVANTDGTGERRLTYMNDALTREIAFSDAERFTYRSVGGLEIEGWLMKPHGYQPGRKYPLALYIHGGPHAAYGEGWFDEFQNLAGAGMFVLFTNPRGSSGYGAEFTYSTRGRWGGEDYEDLMKATDIAAARPDVDSTRMGVTGGSYGGFMTAWITTRTNRFRAAQADRMISNWSSWWGGSDAQGLTEFEFYGRPWDDRARALYDTLSPLRWVHRVRTPTLIVQSEEDHRTPMADAEQWFMALKKQGVPVEFVRYPRSNHDLSRTGEPWLLVDRLGRLRQWFSYWLKDERAPNVAGREGA